MTFPGFRKRMSITDLCLIGGIQVPVQGASMVFGAHVAYIRRFQQKRADIFLVIRAVLVQIADPADRTDVLLPGTDRAYTSVFTIKAVNAAVGRSTESSFTDDDQVTLDFFGNS